MSIITLFIVVLVGIGAGVYYHYIIDSGTVGGIWLAVIVGVIGGVLGFFYISGIIKWLVINNPLNIDFVAVLVGSFLFLWILSKISPR